MALEAVNRAMSSIQTPSSTSTQAAAAVTPAQLQRQDTATTVVKSEQSSHYMDQNGGGRPVMPMEVGSGSGETSVEQEQIGNEQIRKAVEHLTKNMSNSEAVFGIHEGTNRVTIKIVDKSTREVIKELPPEKTLDMIARVWEMAGILVDEKR